MLSRVFTVPDLLLPSAYTGNCDSPAGARYLSCSGPWIEAYMDAFAHYQLPPFLLQKSCDSNPDCAGFMYTNDESQGWLLRWHQCSSGDTCGSVVVKLDALP